MSDQGVDDEEYDVTDTGIIGDMGVALARLRCGQMGHLFREQATHDRGIDAEIELAEGTSATGRIIKAQIKCGASYFSRISEDFFLVRINYRHYEYWRKHSVPVLFLLADHATETCYWQLVSTETVERAGANYVICVPRKQVFNRSAREKVSEIATPAVSPQQFDIFDEEVSTSTTLKRISYHLTLNPSVDGWSKPQIEQLVRQVTASARGASYFGSETIDAPWQGQPPAMVSAYVYFDDNHREAAEPLAKATWVDPSLAAEFGPEFNSNPTDAGGLWIDWSDAFGNVLDAVAEHTVERNVYIEAVGELLKKLFDSTFNAWRWIALGTSRSVYNAKELVTEFDPLIGMIDELPFAPESCSRVAKQIAILRGELDAARNIAARVVSGEASDSDFDNVDKHTQRAFFKTHIVKHELDELV